MHDSFLVAKVDDLAFSLKFDARWDYDPAILSSLIPCANSHIYISGSVH